jgi:hypothetical protein
MPRRFVQEFRDFAPARFSSFSATEPVEKRNGKSSGGLHKRSLWRKIKKRIDQVKFDTISSPTNKVCGCHPEVFVIQQLEPIKYDKILVYLRLQSVPKGFIQCGR